MTAQQVDEFGFLIEGGSHVPIANVEKQERRIQKWTYMLDNWEEFKTQNPQKIQSRVCKGIPHSMRQRAWPVLAGCSEKMRVGVSAWETFVVNMLVENYGVVRFVADIIVQYCSDTTYNDLSQEPNQDSRGISIDSTRTFPNHPRIGSSPELISVLTAISNKHRNPGYCSGMSSLAAACLLVMEDAEDSFWLLECLFSSPRFQVKNLFLEGMEMFGRYSSLLEVVMSVREPRVWEKIQNHGISPAMFATGWFLTIFIRGLRPALWMRIWDMFMNEGYTVLLRAAIACLEVKGPEILAASSFEMMYTQILSAAFDAVDEDRLIKHIEGVRLQDTILDDLKKPVRSNFGTDA